MEISFRLRRHRDLVIKESRIKKVFEPNEAKRIKQLFEDLLAAECLNHLPPVYDFSFKNVDSGDVSIFMDGFHCLTGTLGPLSAYDLKFDLPPFFGWVGSYRIKVTDIGNNNV